MPTVPATDLPGPTQTPEGRRPLHQSHWALAPVRYIRRFGVGASGHNQLRGRAELGVLRVAGGPSGGHAENKKPAGAPVMTSVLRLAAGRPGRPAPASLRSARGR